ncbi:MAG: hypothetical protein EA422_00200 [Gemmatimonadales bacterium]|nr:MAG: hypothetical protein EA422_00200 [Gemmatimonadales bacterium]
MPPLRSETIDAEPGDGKARRGPPLPWRFVILEGGLVTIWFYLVGSLVRWDAASWMDALVLGVLWALYRGWGSRGKTVDLQGSSAGEADVDPVNGDADPAPLWSHYASLAVPWSVTFRKALWIAIAMFPVLLVYDRFFGIWRPMTHVALAAVGIGVLWMAAGLIPRLWLGARPYGRVR